MRRLLAIALLLLASPAWADMYQDAGNAKLPEAQRNLGAMRSIVPQQYGAVGDGVADDTVAIQAWLTDLKTGNYVGNCQGKFRLTASVNAFPAKPYRVIGAGQGENGCNFYIDYNNWTSNAVDLTNPVTPTTRASGADWSSLSFSYNPALTKPPRAISGNYVSDAMLRDIVVAQYTAQRGQCMSWGQPWNIRQFSNISLWGCGGHAISHLVPAGTTFSIAAASTTLTSSASFFTAADVGRYITCEEPGFTAEAFKITAYASPTSVTVGRAAGLAHSNNLCAMNGITGNITAGTNTLTINTANLTANDVGRVVYIPTAGVTAATAKDPLRTTITSVSGTTITLANNAISTAAGVPVIISPAIEVIDANDMVMNPINLEQNAGTLMVLYNGGNLRISNSKFHAYNSGAWFGQYNQSETDFNLVIFNSSPTIEAADIEGTATGGLAQILIYGLTTTGLHIGATTGVLQTGLPRYALLANHNYSGITSGPMHTGGRVADAWLTKENLVYNDGTSLYGAMTFGPVTSYNSGPPLSAYFGQLNTGRLFVNGTLSGAMAPNLVGGLEAIADTSLASNLSYIGKISSLHAVNKYGVAGGLPKAAEGQRVGIFAKIQQDGPVDFTNIGYQGGAGMWSWVLVNQGNTTPGEDNNYTGMASLTEIGGTNSRAYNMFGAEFDVNIGATATAGHRIGVLAAVGGGTFNSPGRAFGFDGAFAISRGAGYDGAWKHGYALRGPHGVWPFASDSTLFGGLNTFNGTVEVPAVAAVGMDMRGIAFNFAEYISDHFTLGPNGGATITASYAQWTLRNTDVAAAAGGLTRLMGLPDGSWIQQINTAAAGDFSAVITASVMSPTGKMMFTAPLAGNIGATLQGGVEMIIDTSQASSLTDIGKINALYAVNKFGTPGGPNAKEGQRAGIFAKVQQDGPADYTSTAYNYNTGVWSWVLVNQGNTAVGQEGNYHGFGGLVEIGGTGTRVFNLHGFEVDTNIGPTALVGNRIGVLSAIGAGTFGAPTRALGFDGAFAAARSSGGDASWKVGYSLRSPNGVWPFGSDSVLFGGLGSLAANSGVPAGQPATPAVAGIGFDMRGIPFTYFEYISDHFQLGPAGGMTITASYAAQTMRNTDVAVGAGGAIRWMGDPGGNWATFINTAPAGDFSTINTAYTVAPTGGVVFGQEIKLAASTVATLPACNAGSNHSLRMVTDANAPAWNATVAGGGAVRVLTLCDGAAWKVR